jgi:hypothetical protein
MPTCKYCGIIRPTSGAIKKHIRLTSTCRNYYTAEIYMSNSSTAAESSDLAPENVNANTHQDGNPDQPAENIIMTDENEPGATHWGADRNSEMGSAQEETGYRDGAWSNPAEWSRYSEAYPGTAGTPISPTREKTHFEEIQNAEGTNGPWGDGCFQSEEEWEVAKWLLRNAGHNQIDKFLKLPMVSFYKLGNDVILT